MLLEVFNLILQKGGGTLCLIDIPTYVDLTQSQLAAAKKDCKWLTIVKFNKLRDLANQDHFQLQLEFAVRIISIGRILWPKLLILSLMDLFKK